MRVGTADRACSLLRQPLGFAEPGGAEHARSSRPPVFLTRRCAILILSRRLDEEIWVGETIRIKIIGIGSGRVRLGISAPEDVPINRAELLGMSSDGQQLGSKLLGGEA